MIELTVALPMWKSKFIGWLPLESLARQKDIDFQWELIVMEEQNVKAFGEKRIRNYTDKLLKAGCVKITYQPLSKWIPLSQKWKRIAQLADVNSKAFVCQAADNYSQPYRLKEAYNLIVKNEFDWISYPFSYFYSVPTDEVFVRGFASHLKKNTPCKGMHYSMKTIYAKNLPHSNKKRVIDKWIFQCVKSKCDKLGSYKWKLVRSPNWKLGFNTHGFHTLSLSRYSKWNDRSKKNAEVCMVKWPTDIIKRLRTLKRKSRK